MVVAILAIGAGLVVWKKKVGGAGHESYNTLTRAEIEILLDDVAKTNPMVLKRLADDPEMKKQQINNLKQLLAFASAAKHEGLTAEPTNKQELENIRAEVLAVTYDKEMHKDQGPMPTFGFITEDMISTFWAEQGPQGGDQGFFAKIFSSEDHVETRTHEAEFNDFLNAKLELLKASNPEMKEKEISDDERKQARELFAKTRIYRAEFEHKVSSGELTKQFAEKANLQVKLQQAQFLARLFSPKAQEQTKVTDEEVAKYITDHPELNPVEKKNKAQEILNRAKNGDDFAALANEFSEDPGNKGVDGAPQGGLYKDVPKSRMVPAFEAAALALEPGQVAPELVETDFGYHIVKLERKLGPSPNKDDKAPAGAGAPPAGDTYDVRHILISTGVKDPDKPDARELPVKDFVRNKLETEKDKGLLDKLVAENNVQVADDFTIPEVTDEQIQQLKDKQKSQMPQGMPPGAQPGAPSGPGSKPGKPEPAKPEAKKK